MTTTVLAIFIREQQDLCYLAPSFNRFSLYMCAENALKELMGKVLQKVQVGVGED